MDIAGKEHWDSIYADVAKVSNFAWKPETYTERLLDSILDDAIKEFKPQSVLEIGCGNSNFLPYYANKYNFDVYGVDYSTRGCELVRDKLKPRYHKNIFCIDFFDEEMKQLPKVDMIYSLGVLEHFDNPRDVLKIFISLLRDNGVIITEVPNLTGKNGKIIKFYQPNVYYKHVIHDESTLVELYNSVGLHCVKCSRVGAFSWELVAWGVEPRLKCVDRPFRMFILPLLRRMNFSDDVKNGPFVYIVGRKLSELC